jgi:hypothetical protein
MFCASTREQESDMDKQLADECHDLDGTPLARWHIYSIGFDVHDRREYLSEEEAREAAARGNTQNPFARWITKPAA